MVELLTVIAVIGALAGLLIPSLLYGKFKARVTTCTNNYRQFALAAAMYAGADSKGRLPSFELPTESSQLKGFHNLYPWIVGLPMLKAMEPYGITQPQMWYCPLRERWKSTATSFQSAYGRPMATMDDLAKFFTDFQKSKYAFTDLNWWVPRHLEGSAAITYPDALLLPARLKTPWPSKMEDSTISTRPILSDWMTGSKDASGESYSSASGAHAFGGKIRNINSAYADGHVTTHSSSNIKWELKLDGGNDDAYIFY